MVEWEGGVLNTFVSAIEEIVNGKHVCFVQCGRLRNILQRRPHDDIGVDGDEVEGRPCRRHKLPRSLFSEFLPGVVRQDR